MQNVNHTEFPVAFRMLLQEEGKKFDIGDSGKFLKKNSGDEEVVGFLNWVFPYAKSLKASDVSVTKTWKSLMNGSFLASQP